MSRQLFLHKVGRMLHVLKFKYVTVRKIYKLKKNLQIKNFFTNLKKNLKLKKNKTNFNKIF